MNRHTLWAMGLVGCVFPTVDDAAVDAAADGLAMSGANQVEVDGMRVSWVVEDRWEDGACVRVGVASAGGDLDWWDLQIQLDRPFEIWIGGYGAARVEPWGDQRVGVMPDNGALMAGVVAEFSYCAEPEVRPVGFSGTAVPAASGSGAGDGSGGSSGGTSSGGEGGGASGALISNGWGLEWQTAGSSFGGDCVEYTLVNLTDEPLADWWAQVILEGPATVTDSWGMAGFTFDSSVLWLLPPEYDDSPIAARGTVTGTVCLDPFQSPLGFNVFGEPGSGGSDADSDSDPDGEVLRGELQDPASGWVLRYSDGGSTASEHCVNLMVANLSGADATDWRAQIQLDARTVITRDWSFEVGTLGAGDLVELVPEPYAQELGHGDVVWGGFCMNPVVTPLSVAVTPAG